MTARSIPLTARLSLIVAIIAVSTSAILIRFSTAPSLVIAFWRLVFSSIMMGMGWFFFEKNANGIVKDRDRSWFLLLVLSGMSLSLHFVFWISSLEFTTVAASVVIVDSSPLLVFLLSWFFLRESLRKMQIMGMLIATVGGIMIAFADWQSQGNNLLGDGLAFLGTVMVAFYLILGRYLRKNTKIFTYTTIVYGVAASLTGMISILLQVPLLGYPLEEFVLFFLMALGPSALGHTLFNYSLKHVRAPVVSTATLGEAIGSTILAFLILGEIPSPLVLFGGLILLFGVFLTVHEPKLNES